MKTEERLKEIAAKCERHNLMQEVCIHVNAGELDVSEVLLHIVVSTTCDGPQIGEFFKVVHKILEEIKRTAGIRIKEKEPERWYYTKPKDKTKMFN